VGRCRSMEIRKFVVTVFEDSVGESLHKQVILYEGGN